jgi:hypothetical protein
MLKSVFPQLFIIIGFVKKYFIYQKIYFLLILVRLINLLNFIKMNVPNTKIINDI